MDYQPDYIREGLSSLENLNRFALTFFKDVAEKPNEIRIYWNIWSCSGERAGHGKGMERVKGIEPSS